MRGEFSIDAGVGQAFEVARRAGDFNLLNAVHSHLGYVAWETGALAETGARLESIEMDQPSPDTAEWLAFARAFWLSESGSEAEAREALHVAMARPAFLAGLEDDALIQGGLLAETAARLGEHEAGARLYDFLLPAADRFVVVSTAFGFWGSVARPLALLAASLGRSKHAEEHFENALVLEEGICTWPWLARTRVHYARALLERGGSARAKRARGLLRKGLATARKLEQRPLVRLAEALLR